MEWSRQHLVCSAFWPNSPRIRTGLFEPKSPLPGNGIFKGRQRGRNGFEGSRTPLRRQRLAKQPAKFGANLREPGNFWLRGLELRARLAVLSNQSLSMPQCCKRGRKSSPYAANPIQHRCRCIVGPYNNGHDGYPRISAADEISSLHPVAENRSVGFREPKSPTVLNCQSCSKIGRSAH